MWLSEEAHVECAAHAHCRGGGGLLLSGLLIGLLARTFHSEVRRER